MKLHARTKLVILLIIPSITFSLLIVNLSGKYLSDFFRGTQQETLSKVSEQITHSLKGSIDQINILAVDLEQRILTVRDKSDIREIIDILSKNRTDFIRGIAFVDINGTAVGSPRIYWDYFSEKEKSIIEDNRQKKSFGVYWSNHFYSLISQGNPYNAASIVVKPVYKDKQYAGSIAIVVDVNKFLSNTAIYGGNYEIRTLLYDRDNSLADTLNPQSYLEGNNRFISEDNLQSFESAIGYLDQNDFYYSVSSLPYHPYWKVVTIGNVQKLESKFKPLNNSVLIVLLFGITGLFFVYLIVLWWFTKPLVQMSRAIWQMGVGNFDYKISMKRNDEFGRVAGEFNRMSGLIKDLFQKLNEANEKKRESDFQALMSQVNPHFLYNTLNSIDIMVDASSKQDVHNAMEMLINLLKYSLNKEGRMSTLEDEFHYIRNYITLQKIRYGNRFEFDIMEPGELSGVKILKLILQPLVENSIFHGLNPLIGRKGYLKIEAWKDKKDLLIKVSDNGVGIPEEALNQVLSGEKVYRSSSSTGIGLVNVHERIQLYYGEEYGLTVKSILDAGTEIIIKVSV